MRIEVQRTENALPHEAGQDAMFDDYSSRRCLVTVSDGTFTISLHFPDHDE
jgi:hypothetical protein